jgi:hypothetical protein
VPLDAAVTGPRKLDVPLALPAELVPITVQVMFWPMSAAVIV